MGKIKGGIYEGERALYNIHDQEIEDAIFQNGESPLKECSNLKLNNIVFKWKYPIWYCNDVEARNVKFEIDARSGLWYCNRITFIDSVIDAPKQFRRCNDITLINVDMPSGDEFFWGSKNLNFKNISLKGNYFCMNSEDVYIDGLVFEGSYVFDGVKNLEIHNANIVSKDSFWNCENVVVYDSKITGEYVGWNSKNVKFVNCEIESEQGLCYMDNLTLINCKLINTNLTFERVKNIDADIKSDIVSVKNPYSGTIKAKSIGEIILDSDIVDKTKTKITVGE